MTTPTHPAVNSNAPGVGQGSTISPTDALNMTLNMLKIRIKDQQTLIAKYNADIKKYTGKNDKTSKSRLAAAKKSLATANTALKGFVTQQTSTQNKLYEATGQYQNLLTGANRDAYMALNSLFQQYNLGSLAGKIYDYVKNGYSSDTISILLQDTPEYKKRFAANADRVKAGLPVLSPAEYISVENSYRQILKAGGLPSGFYDTTEDFTKFISGDMSPTELQSRVDLASQATTLANPAYKTALKQMGLSDGDITAYFLDQTKALPAIQKAAATAAIGAEAIQRGLQFDQQYAQDLATQGVTRDQASQGYAKIGDEFSDLQTLGQIYGGGWTQRSAEEDVFTGGTAASQQRARLIGSEKAAFSGASGAARGGLAQSGGAR